MRIKQASLMVMAALAWWLAALSPLHAEESAGAEPEAPSSSDLEMAPQVPLSATFTFKALVETAKPRLFLGDLATCAGMASICDEAYGVDVGPSPEPGKSQVLHQDRLSAMLAREWPDASLAVQAPKVVKITSTFAEIDEQEILGALKAAVDGRLQGQDRYQLTVEKLALSQAVKLRPGAFHLEFPSLKGDFGSNSEWLAKNLAGTQHLEVQCIYDDLADGGRSFTVQATFALKQKLPVAARALDKGEVIRAEDLADEWVEMNHNSTKLAISDVQLVGRRLKRPVPAMKAIEVSQVEVPKVVKRGQLLKLVVRGKGLDVSGQVVAQGDGGSGQTIEAVYPATKKRLRVRVIDSSTVEYAF